MTKSKRRACWAGVAVVVAAGTLLTVGAAQAQGPGGRPHGPLALVASVVLPKVRAFHQDMAVTPEQREKIRAIIVSHWPEIKKALEGVKAAGRKLEALTRAPQTDEAAIRAASAAVGEALAEGALVRAKLVKLILPVFSAEQQTRIDSFRGEIQGLVDQALEHGPRPLAAP
jgi:Spy/CpxP family protein refolding chaperone